MKAQRYKIISKNKEKYSQKKGTDNIKTENIKISKNKSNFIDLTDRDIDEKKFNKIKKMKINTTKIKKKSIIKKKMNKSNGNRKPPKYCSPEHKAETFEIIKELELRNGYGSLIPSKNKRISNMFKCRLEGFKKAKKLILIGDENKWKKIIENQPREWVFVIGKIVGVKGISVSNDDLFKKLISLHKTWKSKQDLNNNQNKPFTLNNTKYL